jgi:hypothetical protein
MAKKKPAFQRKTRTREHVIADLAINHVERPILLRGFTLERVFHDYGFDLMLFAYNSVGEPEPGMIYLQVKGTEKATRVEGGQAVSFRLSRADLLTWLAEPMPVILCVYDVADNVAFWLYVQRYFEKQPDFNLFTAGKTVQVRIPITQVLDVGAVSQFAQFLDEVLQQTEGRVDHA